MDWLARSLALRADPSRVLPGCRAIISLAYPYPSRKPATPDGFTVSRYSQPKEPDYHHRLRGLAGELAGAVRDTFAGSKTRVCVDSAPILERSFAVASGVGFMAKNNMVIVPGHGSYCFLAEILTTAELPIPEVEPVRNQCGSCTRCIDACPSGALEGPYRLDASRCLSYWSIERKGILPGDAGRAMGDCFLGCDVCQEVCPLNEGTSGREICLPRTEILLGMEETAFERTFGRTAFARVGLHRLKANIEAVVDNRSR
jgi:epoxyqueuosine reductase